MPRIYKIRVHTGDIIRLDIDDIFEINQSSSVACLTPGYPYGVKWNDSLNNGQYHYFGVLEETAMKLSQLTGLPIVKDSWDNADKHSDSVSDSACNDVGLQFKEFVSTELISEVDKYEREKVEADRIRAYQKEQEHQMRLLRYASQKAGNKH